MNDYYREELLSLVDDWTVEQIDRYLLMLEDRVKNTKEQIHALRSLRRRKTRNKNAKETGKRGA